MIVVVACASRRPARSCSTPLVCATLPSRMRHQRRRSSHSTRVSPRACCCACCRRSCRRSCRRARRRCQVATLRLLRAEVAIAATVAGSAIAWADLAPRQTIRTATHARRLEARRLAWTYLWHVPRSWYCVLSFCFRLRARAMASPSAADRAAAAERQSCVLRLRAAQPKPLTSYDVGVDSDGTLLYRSMYGVVSSAHPASEPMDWMLLGNTLLPDGTFGVMLQPPADSPLDPCPDVSGAICYVDRDSGDAQWDAPPGSTALQPRPLLERSFRLPPPS
jgi:hypothetical protein